MTEQNNDYQIRRVMVSDLATLKTLLRYLHDSDPWQKEQDIAAEVTLLRISQEYGRHLLVAEKDNLLIGTIDLVLISGLTRNLGRFGLIENLVVAPDYRRQGLGRALLEEAISIARRENCYKVELVSSAQREVAQSLYKATGFDASVFGYRKYFNSPNLNK